MRRILFSILVTLCLGGLARGQANGKLQIHHIDIGQGDGAVLISPGGQVVLFDAGEDLKTHDCNKEVAYLDQLGVKHVDYLVVSHYHFDHIGCIPDVLNEFPLQATAIAFDRGESYPGKTFTNYLRAVGSHRKTAAIGDSITLDKSAATPVVIKVVAVDAKSSHGEISTSNENDLSLAVVVSFGSFKEEIGGDLSGDDTGTYKDVETPVAPDVGKIDVYKVHHHCSSHSTNDAWMNATKPSVGVVSTGDLNDYGHPAPDCLERLHKNNVKLYWTETGKGAEPESGVDVVGGNIIIEVAANASSFTVTSNGSHTDTFALNGTPGGSPPSPPGLSFKFAWSKNSKVYHLADCQFVQNIAPANLEQGNTPPAGKTLHKGCPK